MTTHSGGDSTMLMQHASPLVAHCSRRSAGAALPHWITRTALPASPRRRPSRRLYDHAVLRDGWPTGRQHRGRRRHPRRRRAPSLSSRQRDADRWPHDATNSSFRRGPSASTTSSSCCASAASSWQSPSLHSTASPIPSSPLARGSTGWSLSPTASGATSNVCATTGCRVDRHGGPGNGVSPSARIHQPPFRSPQPTKEVTRPRPSRAGRRSPGTSRGSAQAIPENASQSIGIPLSIPHSGPPGSGYRLRFDHSRTKEISRRFAAFSSPFSSSISWSAPVC